MIKIRSYEKRLKILRHVQHLAEAKEILAEVDFSHKYANRNRAIAQTHRFQDQILDNIIEESVYGTAPKINNINEKSREVISKLLYNNKMGIYKRDSKILDSVVENHTNNYSKILTNRIKIERNNLESKIEKEKNRERYKNLSEEQLKEELKRKFKTFGKGQTANIIKDAIHSQEGNISIIRASNKGYEYKIWMNGRLRGKTRAWHVAKHITPVRIDEYFDLYGSYHAQAMYPGDLYSGAENVANCRCWLRYSHEKPESLKNRQTIFKAPESSYLHSKKSGENSSPAKITVSNTHENIKTKVQTVTQKIKSKLKIENTKTTNVKLRPKQEKKSRITNKIREIKEKRKLKKYVSKFGKNIKVYKYKKVNIILQNSPNYIPLQEIEKLYDSLPSILTKYPEEIVIKNERMMIGGSEVLGYVEGRNRYCNILKSNSSLNEYKNTIIHELVHILDNNNGLFKFKISNSKEWKNACKEDEKINFVIDPWTGRRISNNYVSKYSMEVYFDNRYPQKIKQSEDLAESVMRYLDPNDTEFVRKFPNRAKFIKELLGVEPGEIQIKQRR